MRFVRFLVILVGLSLLSAVTPRLALADPSTYPMFNHTATVTNSMADYTILDNRYANGNPKALLIVTPSWNFGGTGGIYDPHNLGVFYTGSNWAIFHQDGSAIPLGAKYNVQVLAPAANVLLQTATSVNTSGNEMKILSPLLSGVSSAQILITPVFTGVYNNHPTGLYYSSGAWLIINEDGAPMPLGAAFTVYIGPAHALPFGAFFTRNSTAFNTVGDFFIPTITGFSEGVPSVYVFITPATFTLNSTEPHPTGVYYDGYEWDVFNEDTTAMSIGLSFTYEVITCC